MKPSKHYVVVLSENQRLETKRLILRPVTLADAEDMHEYGSDEDTAFFVFPLQKTIADTRENIANFYMQQPLGKYGIELKSTGKLIGAVDITINKEHNKGELGYVINKEYRRCGYAKEASRAILSLAFEQMELSKVYAVHDERNLVSGKVMKSLGMIHEATLQDNRIKADGLVTDVIYGMTKNSYFQQNTC